MSEPEPGHDQGRGTISPEDRAAFRRRTDELTSRLDKVAKTKVAHQRKPSPWSNPAAGKAVRFAVELVVGVGLGALAGWYLDDWLGTRPWMLLLCVVLGFAGAIANIIRAAKEMQAKMEPMQRSAPSVSDDRDDT